MEKFGRTLQINSLPGRENKKQLFAAAGCESQISGSVCGTDIQQGRLVVAVVGQGFRDDLLDFFQLQGFGDEAVEGIGQDFFGADIAR